MVLPEIINEEVTLLLIIKLFRASTSLFLQGNNKAIKIFMDEYRRVNGIKAGSPLCRETPFKLYGAHPPSETACHMSGVGLTGMSKLTITNGLNWTFESFKHDKIGDCIKITVDVEKKLFLFVKHPLGDCKFNKCNGNHKCSFHHPNGFFAEVKKEE